MGRLKTHWRWDDFGTIELAAFEVRTTSGDIILNDHDQVAWVTADNIAQYDFTPADLPFVEMIRRGDLAL